MTRFIGHALLFVAVFAAALLLVNTDLVVPESEARPLVIAHDGRAISAAAHRPGYAAAEGPGSATPGEGRSLAASCG